jgi:hypothetical protein
VAVVVVGMALSAILIRAVDPAQGSLRGDELSRLQSV